MTVKLLLYLKIVFAIHIHFRLNFLPDNKVIKHHNMQQSMKKQCSTLKVVTKTYNTESQNTVSTNIYKFWLIAVVVLMCYLCAVLFALHKHSVLL